MMITLPRGPADAEVCHREDGERSNCDRRRPKGNPSGNHRKKLQPDQGDRGFFRKQGKDERRQRDGVSPSGATAVLEPEDPSQKCDEPESENIEVRKGGEPDHRLLVPFSNSEEGGGWDRNAIANRFPKPQRRNKAGVQDMKNQTRETICERL